MRAKKLVGFYNKAYNIGRANARVFPLPVSAKAIMSLPFNVYGSDYA
jgi:hypothetical protein